jgi:pimeloyl-ACP methyl ester carboxylesterase
MTEQRLGRRAVVLGLAAAGASAHAATLWTWRSFRADDGTVLLYQHGGRGPGVVVVHGASDGPSDWRPVAERLVDRFSFFLLARRSGAGSGRDARELADVARLLKISGPGAALFGHAAGGGLAADCARRSALPGRLVLFDPILAREPKAYASISAPTWIITGEKSPEHPFQDAGRALARVLPRAQVRMLKGQGDEGMTAAPDQFAQLLASCLTERA